jgi:hypothetical protein
MILKANSYSIGRKSGEIWTSQTLLQPISFKSDRLLGRSPPRAGQLLAAGNSIQKGTSCIFGAFHLNSSTHNFHKFLSRTGHSLFGPPRAKRSSRPSRNNSLVNVQ